MDHRHGRCGRCGAARRGAPGGGGKNPRVRLGRRGVRRAALGLAGVGWAIWHTTDALIPPATTLATLETPPLAELRAQIVADPAAFFGPFGSSAAQVQAACQRFETAAAQIAVMIAAEPDAGRQRILAQGQADALANAAQASARLRWLLSLAHAWRVRDQLRRARLNTFAAAAVAALGAVLFLVATSGKG